MTKNHEKTTQSRPNLIARIDYQPSAVVRPSAIPTLKNDDALRLEKYRDRLLTLLSNRIPGNLFDVLDERSAMALQACAVNTSVSRYADLIQYGTFCCEQSLDILPFQDYVLDAYLSHMVANGRCRSTIDRHMASLVYWSGVLELPDPRQSFRIKTRLQTIRQLSKRRPRQAEGLRAEHLEVALDKFNPEIARDAQDITLLYVAFETLTRREELVGFNWDDFEPQPDGSGTIFLSDSKTDQDGEGTYLYLSSTTTSLLLGWQNRCNVRVGAIYKGIYSNGTLGDRLSTKGVERCFKRIAKRLNLDPTLFSGHSTRVGAAQEMVERNIDATKIMLSGRWKSMSMLVRYSEKLMAKKGGMAEMAKQLGWDETPLSENKKIGTDNC